MIINLVRRNIEDNYKIVTGNVEPYKPDENTIWVQTQDVITGHVFRNDYPTDPYEGLLFIRTNDVVKDTVYVDIDRTVAVHPMYAKLYVNGAYKSVAVRKYTSRTTWVTWWDGNLLDTDVSGGILLQSGSSSSVTFSQNTLKLSNTKVGAKSIGIVRTEKLVDFTGFKRLRIGITSKTDTNLDGLIYITIEPSVSTGDGKYTMAELLASSNPSSRTITVTNKYNEPCRVHIEVHTNDDAIGNVSVHIDELQLLSL